MKTETYTIQHPVELELCVPPYSDACVILLGITSLNEEENELIGENGKYSCFDGEVRFLGDYIEVIGGNQPGGGSEYKVKLIIPLNKIRQMRD